jgi:hypothetical protein
MWKLLDSSAFRYDSIFKRIVALVRLEKTEIEDLVVAGACQSNVNLSS